MHYSPGKLVWIVVLARASRGWHGLTYTPAVTRVLHDLHRDLFAPPATSAHNLPTGATSAPLPPAERDPI
jgi:hypothetical protein